MPAFVAEIARLPPLGKGGFLQAKTKALTGYGLATLGGDGARLCA